MIQNVYRIKSRELAAKGEKFESAFKGRAEAKLAYIQKYVDPQARLLTIPTQGR